ncbi:ATP-grasp domain-containing protein [Undibacterium sp. Di27W]|uniref:ATP-grasp domain-containing protein n=1 Tax=Undibacterium sp. Di27W TaxID=3413036 RepID=UPI003BF39A19
MSILILSNPLDVHAAAVHWGLKMLGCDSILWDWSDFPKSDALTLEIDETGNHKASMVIAGRECTGPFDVIWNRRAGTATPMLDSHPEDVVIIQRESNEFLKSISSLIGSANSLWVNSPAAGQQADMKPAQLLAARALGFKIPDTLIGNDFLKVKNFFEKHDGKIIYKAFFQGYWHHEQGSVTGLRTAALSEEHFQDDYGIRACPGIFQVLVEKSYELRVTVMGDTVLAAAIDSQSKGETIDWRCDLGADLPLKKIELPAEIADRCIALCRKLGLVFGCIDLIVNKAGEYIFLEINEAGQFLWKEGIDPDLLTLDTFCRLLASAVPSTHLTDKPTLHFADWEVSKEGQEYHALYLKSLEKHALS